MGTLPRNASATISRAKTATGTISLVETTKALATIEPPPPLRDLENHSGHFDRPGRPRGQQAARQRRQTADHRPPPQRGHRNLESREERDREGNAADDLVDQIERDADA